MLEYIYPKTPFMHALCFVIYLLRKSWKLHVYGILKEIVLKIDWCLIFYYSVFGMYFSGHKRKRYCTNPRIPIFSSTTRQWMKKASRLYTWCTSFCGPFDLYFKTYRVAPEVQLIQRMTAIIVWVTIVVLILMHMLVVVIVAMLVVMAMMLVVIMAVMLVAMYVVMQWYW